MITRKMQKFLEEIEKNPQLMKKIKTCVYMNRIQKRIEGELDRMLWLAIHNPKILLDEDKEYRDETGKIVCHRRMKKLLLTIKALNPKMEVELVLKNIDFPDKEQPLADYRELVKLKETELKNVCPKCELPLDLCTCKEEAKEEERTSIQPRPTN
jgi:hypothetical protein